MFLDAKSRSAPIVISIFLYLLRYNGCVLTTPQREAVIAKLTELLREKRLRKELSVNEVATRSGLSHAMVSRVEKRERLPTIDTLLRISEALEIDLARLIRKAVASVRPTMPAKTPKRDLKNRRKRKEP